MLERERMSVCVCIGEPGRWAKGKGRQRYLKKLEEGGSRYARREPGDQVNMRQVSIRV